MGGGRERRGIKGEKNPAGAKESKTRRAKREIRQDKEDMGREFRDWRFRDWRRKAGRRWTCSKGKSCRREREIEMKT